MKKWAAILVLALPLSCGQEATVAPPLIQPSPALPGVIVEAGWLAKTQASTNPLIIDARPLSQYQAGHIPGAVSLPVTDLNGEGKNQHNLGSIPQIEALFGGVGLRMDRPVVVYDGAVDHRPAARLFWALEVHGHPESAVLSGGLPAWQTVSTQPLQQAAPSLKPVTFVAVLKPNRLATELQVLRASSTAGALLLDARPKSDYLGETSGGARKGHIDGAQHHDFADNLLIDTASGTCQLHSLEVLQSLYATLPSEAPIITYCNTGTHASVAYLALRSLGKEVAVYDGGWVEWSANPRLPIQTGQNP